MFAVVVVTFARRLKRDWRRCCRCRAGKKTNRSNRERRLRHCDRSHRSVPLIERNRALELCGTRASHPGPRVTKGLPQRAPMLNSTRRHCISPRRGRRVEWSDPRRGSERLHFRARRICRRYASDASQESVSNAGSIDVTTADKSLVIDSVKRCKGRAGIIESRKLVWRKKEEPMGCA